MWHHRLSLSAKLSSIAALLICALFTMLGVALHVLARVETTAAELTVLREAQRRSQNADMLHDAVRNAVLSRLVGEASAEPDRNMEDDTQEEGDALHDELAHLSGMPLPLDLREMVMDTSSIVSAYVAEAERTAWLARADRKAALERMQKFDASFESAKMALARQTEALGRASQSAAAVRARAGAEAKRAILLTGILSSFISVALVALIARSIRRSLERVRDAAAAVAKGKLEERSEVLGTDEIGQLGASVNRMADHLQETIDRMRVDAERGAFGAQLVDAFDMADSEPEAYAVVTRAMASVAPDLPMELLIADSSKAHLERATEHPSAGGPGCRVDSPFSCVAVRRGNLVAFESSDALDACPHLRGRASGQVSAVCVPVSFMGRALGVLHTTGPAGKPMPERQVTRLQTLGAQTGGRIGTVRAFERTQLQASTDALTGLPNRRALEEAMREIVNRSEPFALLMCDLDHFKRLNDELGHSAGDAALRLFSEVLRSAIRQGDHAARWGGEEFCFLLGGSSAEQAVAWTDRLREQLACTIAKNGSPLFTASFGVADSTMSRELGQLIRLADEALYQAKGRGRDRAAIAQFHSDSRELVRRDTEQNATVNLRMVSDAA